LSDAVELRVFETADEAREAAARELADAARAGKHIALSGGSSPGKAFARAAELQPDWGEAEIWWGDERCVHPSDSRSNYRLARERLLDRLSRLPRAIHRIRGELEPEEAAELYHEELDGVLLGLAFQGIGPDGHTASLFPNDPALTEKERRAVAVHRDDVDRVTLTLPVLCAAETVLFLALGDEKAAAVRAAFEEPPDPKTPASLVRSDGGRTVALLDRAAAAELPS
jgi:6-phosphogluconolactonase